MVSSMFALFSLQVLDILYLKLLDFCLFWIGFWHSVSNMQGFLYVPKIPTQNLKYIKFSVVSEKFLSFFLHGGVPSSTYKCTIFQASIIL